MKLFLKKASFFIVLVISVIVSLYFLSDHLIKQVKPELLRISNNISIVFAGDSNVECAINDRLISNSINIAQSGEAYLFTFAKLQSLLENNPGIEIIFLGFSLNNILKSTEDLWLSDDSFVIEKIKNYNYLLSGSDKKIIKDGNIRAFTKGVLQSIFINLSSVILNHTSVTPKTKIRNFGGYKYISWDRLSQDIARESENVKERSIGKVQINYIKKISDLCRNRSVRLILFNTPKNKYYLQNRDKVIIDEWLSVRNELPEDSLLDLSNFFLPDSCFGDLMHLNYKGANIFSSFLNGEMNSYTAR